MSAAQKKPKANLFIAGAPKCGTTAWHAYLGTHPDIFFSEYKEPNYFALDIPRMRRITSLDEYEDMFERGRDAKYRGEASCLYLETAAAAEAIHDYNPDARILLFLRRQEYSVPSLHHQLLYRYVDPIEDFETAWRLSGKRPPETISKYLRDVRLLDYASRGDYYRQVSRFLDVFPREQVLIIDFDAWTADPRSTYLQILDFLGVEDDGRTDFPRINEAKAFKTKWLGKLIAHPPWWLDLPVRLLRKLTRRRALGIAARASDLLASKGYKTKVSPELREEIRRHYEADNRRLQKLAGWPPRG